jgi:uncharacterized protein DUF5615
MLSLLIDQDLDHDILRGLIRRIPQLDALTAFEIGLGRATDPDLLTWAAQEKRVIITHDKTTMPSHAADLLHDGKDIAGLIIVPRRLSLLKVLDDLELIITCSEADDWNDVICYLPL